MGFFDRLAKFLLGRKDPEVKWPTESTSYVSPSPFTEAPATAVVPNGTPQLTETVVSGAAGAFVLAEVPSMLSSVPAPLIALSDTPAAVAGEATVTDFFADDFDQDLDDIFDSLISHGAASESESTSGEMVPGDQLVVEKLFADIAANYARPVKNFIFELKRGTATREWIDICRPAMHGITRAAEGMGLSVAAQRMMDFEAALLLAQGSEQRVLAGEIRDRLLLCYEDLTKAMPLAFVVGEEEQEREGIIINSLLMQIQGLGRVTVEKLYGAGLTSLDTFFLAERDDVAAATGIPQLLSERICEKFRAYRAELEGPSRDVGDSGQRTRLAEMLAYLRQQHNGFHQASENGSSGPVPFSKKREYRQQRQAWLLQINIVLAEMGELDLVNDLKKLSFKRRIRRLEEFLASPPTTIVASSRPTKTEADSHSDEH